MANRPAWDALTAQRQDWSRLPAWQAPGRGCCAPRLSTPGYVDDDDGLQQTAEQVDRLLDAGGLGDMDAAFLLEGLVRGQAALR
jgi:hypothetical protein